MKTFIQQPTPAPAQVELPQEFPEIPQEVIDRFGEPARDWQRRLNEFWTRSNQAIQQAQDQTARQINSSVVFTVDTFRIYVNGVPSPMFGVDATGVRLGNVLVVNSVARSLYIGRGQYQDAQTPFYIDTLGKFSLGANLTWDPDTATLTVTGTIAATSGSIGGFDIGADYIRDTANSFGLSSTITGGDDVRLWAGSTFANRATAPFRVTEAGALVATSATISGSIIATSGTIGGFDVGSDYIRDTANSFGLASTVTGGNDVRFWAGDTFANRASAPVRMFEDGLVWFERIVTGEISITASTAVSNIALDISGGLEFSTNCRAIQIGNNLTMSSTFNGTDFFGITVDYAINKSTFTGLLAYGINIELNSATGTGTIDNAYGLYIDTVNIGTNNYGIYVATTAVNYFAGVSTFNLGLNATSIGATTPGTGAFTTVSASTYGAVGVALSSAVGWRVLAPTASNQAITAIESAGVHQINFRPNISSVNIITSDYLSGATYLPLALTGRSNAGDFVLQTDGTIKCGSLAGAGTRTVVADANGVLSAP